MILSKFKNEKLLIIILLFFAILFILKNRFIKNSIINIFIRQKIKKIKKNTIKIDND